MAKPFDSRNRKRSNNYVRKNEKIRAREVRLIGPNGDQLGLISKTEALEAAKAVGLDLVEISPMARPPVCKVMDFGKFMYEQSKRQKESKSKAASTSKIKEVKFRVRTEEHDYLTKLRHGEEFLYKGNKLKLSLMFRGREQEHKDIGVEVIRRASEDLAHVGTSDTEPRLAGRNVNLVMSPLPATKRKAKYNDDLAPAQ